MDTIDIKKKVDQLIADSEASLLSIAKNDVPEVVDATKAFLDGLKTRGTDYLNVIADMSEEGKKVDKLAFLKESFQVEEKIFENEMIAYGIIGKQVAQDIINSIQGILIKAVFAVLPAV